jgi:hypothetical protein
MSDTQATNWTQDGYDLRADAAPTGWAAEPPATAPSATGWAAPIGIPTPLPPPASPASPPTNLIEALATLPGGWYTLPSERIRAADFEHIVIGPAGVFTITSAPNSNAHNAQQAATQATEFLDWAGLVEIQVQAVLVFIGAPLHPAEGFDVIVATLQDLSRTMSSLPTTLTPLQVQSARNLAERHDTWIKRIPAKG